MKRELTISGDQRSGKTHLMLKMAIDCAADGRRVHYFCGSNIMAREALNRVADGIDPRRVKSIRRSIGTLRVEMLDGGFIAFSTGCGSYAGRGITADDLFLDDPECYADNIDALIITTASSADATITRSELTR